jgi:hypothetical protein
MNTKRNATRFVESLALLGLTLLGAGCQIVHVQDQEGKPVFWAEVRTRTATSESNFPVMTDLLGNATLLASDEDEGVQEFLTVSKEGYIPVSNFVRTREGKMVVTLQETRAVPNRFESPNQPNPAWKTGGGETSPQSP